MGKQILIIDDDLLIRQLLYNYLNTAYDIELKNDGHQALKWLKDGNKPDLILLDVEMPEMNGRVFIRRIKTSPLHNDIPIIIVSGSNSNLLRNSFLKAGAADFIVKPFQQDILNETINNVLNKKLGI